MIQIHDIVGRKSYDCDVFFRVIDVKDNVAILYGEDFRLVADAPVNDLKVIDQDQLLKQAEKNVQEINVSNFLLAQEQEKIKQKKEYELTEGFREENDFFHIPGRVVHLDGDRKYLEKCLLLYKKMRVPVVGIHCHEKEMPNQVGKLIDQYRPDILVITGHDAYSKVKGDIHDMAAYRHSKEFVQTVYEARKKEPNLDQLVIFAGACQSHFESLIQAGANFASSPSRVNIHALDPVYIVGKISFTPFMERVHVWDALKSTLTGEKGLGGIETKGVLRIGMPYRVKPKIN
ncbi:MAG: yabG [Bacillales bacterium]|jgi:spore coat assembly protein|nr:yabG [Bacillales bacterium]